MKNNPVLHLNLKKKWFDMILSGEKKEEYREMTDYWNNIFRFVEVINWKIRDKSFIRIKGVNHIPSDVIICFSNGYRKDRKQFYIKCEDLSVDYGIVPWGAEIDKLYFVLSLGKIL